MPLRRLDSTEVRPIVFLFLEKRPDSVRHRTRPVGWPNAFAWTHHPFRCRLQCLLGTAGIDQDRVCKARGDFTFRPFEVDPSRPCASPARIENRCLGRNSRLEFRGTPPPRNLRRPDMVTRVNSGDSRSIDRQKEIIAPTGDRRRLIGYTKGVHHILHRVKWDFLLNSKGGSGGFHSLKGEA